MSVIKNECIFLHERPQHLEPGYLGYTLVQLTWARQSICALVSLSVKWKKIVVLSHRVL